MFPYEVVKSIHDQRMHQYRIEAERAHLLRQLRKNRPMPSLRWLATAVDTLRQLLTRRPQPAV